jgi:hypothetical protein
MDWSEDSGNWSLLCGQVLGILARASNLANWQGVEPIMDDEGYTNAIMVTTHSGGEYLITIEPVKKEV